MRDSHNLTPAEYRNKLFSNLFNWGVSRFKEDVLVDDLITIDTGSQVAYIHLIYHFHLGDKVALIKNQLVELANK